MITAVVLGFYVNALKYTGILKNENNRRHNYCISNIDVYTCGINNHIIVWYNLFCDKMNIESIKQCLVILNKEIDIKNTKNREQEILFDVIGRLNTLKWRLLHPDKAKRIDRLK